MSDFFADLDRLRLAGSNIETSTPPTTGNKVQSARRRVQGEFLKGPVPLAWLSAASKLPGKAALAVGLALWFEAGRRRSQTVTLTSAILARFGVNRKGKYRGLASLEQEGLAEVVQVPRRNPVVTILDLSPDQEHLDPLKKGKWFSTILADGWRTEVHRWAAFPLDFRAVPAGHQQEWRRTRKISK